MSFTNTDYKVNPLIFRKTKKEKEILAVLKKQLINPTFTMSSKYGLTAKEIKLQEV